MEGQRRGLDTWVLRVRNELASTTGLADFNTRVQQRGFDWMEGFVDSVLRDEHIVEIAKTPGRQKSPKKMTRSKTAAVAASAAKIAAINSELQSADEDDKENSVASPSKASARKVQRALFAAANDHGDSDDDNENVFVARSPSPKRAASPLKSLAFEREGSPIASGSMTKHPFQSPPPPSQLSRTASRSKSPSKLPTASGSRSPSKARFEETKRKQPPPIPHATRPVPNRSTRPSPVTAPAAPSASTAADDLFEPTSSSSSAHRAPLAVLAERPQDTPPRSSPSDAEIPELPPAPEIPVRARPVPPPPPSPKPQHIMAPSPASPMKIDEEGSFRSVPLSTPRRSRSHSRSHTSRPPSSVHVQDIAVPAPSQQDEDEDMENEVPVHEPTTPLTPLSPSAPPLLPDHPPRLSHPRSEKHYPPEVEEDRPTTPPVLFAAEETVPEPEEKEPEPVPAPALSSHPTPAVNAHYEIVVPLNDEGGQTSKPSRQRESQTRRSDGTGLRRSTFARSFAPRSRVTSSGDGPPPAVLAGEPAPIAARTEEARPAAVRMPTAEPETVATGSKRKSTAVESPHVEPPKKVQKVQAAERASRTARTASPLPTASDRRATRERTASVEHEVLFDADVPSTRNSATAVVPAPGPAEGTDSAKPSLANLAALVQGISTDTLAGSGSGSDLGGYQKRPPSMYPNTRTFDMRELMGADYKTPAKDRAMVPSSSPYDYSESASRRYSAEVPQDDEDEFSDGDLEEDEGMEEDEATKFDPSLVAANAKRDGSASASASGSGNGSENESFTPQNTPPRMFARANASVPDANSRLKLPVPAPAPIPVPVPAPAPLVRASSDTVGSSSRGAGSPTHARAAQLEANTSASSLLSAAKGLVSSFFKASPTPAPAPAPAPSPPPMQEVRATTSATTAAPRTFNPFAVDVVPASRPTVAINPFLHSPVKPLPPAPAPARAEAAPQSKPQSKSSQPPPALQQPQEKKLPLQAAPVSRTDTQSTVLSSQYTNYFDSQPTTGRDSYGGGYDTDITESQSGFDESVILGKSVSVSASAGAEEGDGESEVAAALGRASPDASLRVVRPSPPEPAEEEQEPEQEGPVSKPSTSAASAPSNIPTSTTATKKAPPGSTSKTLKHAPSMMSLAAKNKLDAQKAYTEPKRAIAFGSAVPSKQANGTLLKKAELDSKKRERDEKVVVTKKVEKGKFSSDEETSKKRKVEVEIKGKAKAVPTLKATSASFSQMGPPKQPPRPPPPFKSTFKPTSTLLASSSSASSSASNSTTVMSKPAGGLPTKSVLAPGPSAVHRPAPQPHTNPQAQIQAKMQATLEAHIAKEKAAQRAKLAPKATAPEEPEEDEFELPDIASEYSDSDDESRPSKILADWAEPSQLERALYLQQQTVDPDELFGEIGEPDLEVIFGSKTKNKFRVRSSSANWHDGDGLTPAEAEEYARRMGHKR